MKDYIIPTKKQPIFKASCNAFGTIETNTYKDALVDNCIMSVFSISFSDAVNMLHQWIVEESYLLNDSPKCKFELYLVDGTLDKSNEIKQKLVYSISARKAKKLLL